MIDGPSLAKWAAGMIVTYIIIAVAVGAVIGSGIVGLIWWGTF